MDGTLNPPIDNTLPCSDTNISWRGWCLCTSQVRVCGLSVLFLFFFRLAEGESDEREEMTCQLLNRDDHAQYRALKNRRNGQILPGYCYYSYYTTKLHEYYCLRTPAHAHANKSTHVHDPEVNITWLQFRT